MSLFLGKIHYWLFEKIKWFENLEGKIVDWAENQNDLPIEDWKKDIYEKYGNPLPNKPLEDMIDTSNIHGWLQSQISSAEGREAAFITRILNISNKYEKDLTELFKKEGLRLSSECKNKYDIKIPEEMYQILNNFILEGMPCDRTNEILDNNKEVYRWITLNCIHTSYWENEGGSVNNFYKLRESFVKSFIENLNSNFFYEISIVNGKRVHSIINKSRD